MGDPDTVLIAIGSFNVLNAHFYYWTGTALIALFVLGGCNAANLLDGLSSASLEAGSLVVSFGASAAGRGEDA